jgi:ABC-type amino acid transport substrate-binding protein
MKKLIALILALALVLPLCACGEKADSQTTRSKEMIIGTLSLLNMTEEEYLTLARGRFGALTYLAEQGAFHSNNPDGYLPDSSADMKVVFFDTLDAMLMALEAGDITSGEVPVCVAEYLCAHNDRLITRGSYDLSNADDHTKQIAYRLGVGYSFLLTEANYVLRDRIDQALAEMKADGTLDALVKTYITDAVNAEPQPVEFTRTDGETIRVAVTGSLPPMDYVSADGTPAGFNTAILAELSRRMNVNFELVQVDSVGRAAALASGQVDLVFWTNGSHGDMKVGRKAAEEAQISEEQTDQVRSLGGGLSREQRKNKDIPDDTITTQPYFSDLLIPVTLK